MINTKNLSNFDQFKHQAEIGCAEAQFLLGIYYFIRISDNGIHSKYSGELILSHLRRDIDELLSIPVSFAMMNADSSLNLGECCLTIAFEWFEKAAIQGYIAAHEWLALLYREGLGVEKNDILAYSHILYAAENNGSLDAYYQLSLCYLNGLGTEKKPEKGIEWCLKAVEKNHPESLYLLAYCYFEGNGVAKDLLIGLDWLNKAKEIKEIVIEYRIMMLLAEAYANGLGIEKNNELALVWYEKILEKISSEEYVEVWNQENGFLNGDSYFKAAVFYFDIKGEKPKYLNKSLSV
jgi:TPR repeat protein